MVITRPGPTRPTIYPSLFQFSILYILLIVVVISTIIIIVRFVRCRHCRYDWLYDNKFDLRHIYSSINIFEIDRERERESNYIQLTHTSTHKPRVERYDTIHNITIIMWANTSFNIYTYALLIIWIVYVKTREKRWDRINFYVYRNETSEQLVGINYNNLLAILLLL